MDGKRTFLGQNSDVYETSSPQRVGEEIPTTEGEETERESDDEQRVRDDMEEDHHDEIRCLGSAWGNRRGEEGRCAGLTYRVTGLNLTFRAYLPLVCASTNLPVSTSSHSICSILVLSFVQSIQDLHGSVNTTQATDAPPQVPTQRP